MDEEQVNNQVNFTAFWVGNPLIYCCCTGLLKLVNCKLVFWTTRDDEERPRSKNENVQGQYELVEEGV